MKENLNELLSTVTKDVVGYLPHLSAGIVLLLVGWIGSWFAKRVIIQIAVIIKLDRFLIRTRWKKAFSQADVRYGFYNLLGNIGFIVVFLIFLHETLSVWKLQFLSDLLSVALSFFPRIIFSFIIFGSGWLVAELAAKGLANSLGRENIPRSSLIALTARILLIIIFSAMALAELGIAHDIVVIGFAILFGAIGIGLAVLLTVTGKTLINSLLPSKEK